MGALEVLGSQMEACDARIQTDAGRQRTQARKRRLHAEDASNAADATLLDLSIRVRFAVPIEAIAHES